MHTTTLDNITQKGQRFSPLLRGSAHQYVRTFPLSSSSCCPHTYTHMRILGICFLSPGPYSFMHHQHSVCTGWAKSHAPADSIESVPRINRPKEFSRQTTHAQLTAENQMGRDFWPTLYKATTATIQREQHHSLS